MSAVRTIAAAYAWRRPETLQFVRNEFGRLYLCDDVLGRPLYFAGAQTTRLTALIVSREPRIGIEIVHPAAARALGKTIEPEISDQERETLAGLSPAAHQRALLSIWTRKRALQSANAGTALADLKSIVVGTGELAIELPREFGWAEHWRLYGFTMRSGEIGSIAVCRHERLLVLGAGDRRRGAEGVLPGHERRRRVEFAEERV